MMNRINIVEVQSRGKILRITYEISEGLKEKFSGEHVFEVEYSENISMVPESVLVIPFVCNVLPIAWLADATLEIPQLDKDFYEGISGVLEGYRNMSPMLEFKGDVRVGLLVDNNYTPLEKTATFFSGGVDAFATLVAHAEEKPRLVTLWGADVKLTDTEGWERVKQHVVNTCKDFDLLDPLLVRSNFRMLVNEGALDELVAASGDGWWHGYQHGIAIIGHAAPLAYLHQWETIYIASSNTPDKKIICASDPTIDNEVHLVSTKVWHDQYAYNRQQKVQHIVEYCQETGRVVQLRVCWQSEGGSNCGHCEKCIRSLFNLLAEGVNPADYGFETWEKKTWSYELPVRESMNKAIYIPTYWIDIQDRFQKTQAYRNDKRINWIYSLDVTHPLTFPMRLKSALRNRLPIVWRVLRGIKSICSR